MKEGDIILWVPRHAAILYQDAGRKGYLDCDDLVIQTLGHEPEIISICKAYGIPEEILRWIK